MKENLVLNRILHPPPLEAKGWKEFEAFFGKTFPSDYKEILNWVNPLEMFSFAFLMNPFDGSGGFSSADNLMVDFVSSQMQSIQGEMKYSLKEFHTYPENNSLFPIGGTENGGVISFIVRNDPDDWRVIVSDESFGEYEVFDTGIRSFLFSFATGETLPRTFPRKILQNQGWPFRVE